MGGFINPNSFTPPSRQTMEDARKQAELDRQARITQAQRSGQGFYSDPGLLGSLVGQHPTPPAPAPTQLRPLSDPHGTLMALDAPQPKPRDPRHDQIMAVADAQPAPTQHRPGSIEAVGAQTEAARSAPRDVMSELMAGVASPDMRRPDPVRDFQNQASQAMPSAQPRSNPMRVQRDATGRIIGASNQADAQGEVFDGGDSAVSNPGGQGDEAYENYHRNSGRLDEHLGEQANEALLRKLAQDPFARENAQTDRAVQMAELQNQYGMDRDAAKQAGRYSEVDSAIDAETRQDLKEIDSVPDGTAVGAGGQVMSPQFREQLKQKALEVNRQQKLEIRQRAFRAPSATESMDLG